MDPAPTEATPATPASNTTAATTAAITPGVEIEIAGSPVNAADAEGGARGYRIRASASDRPWLEAARLVLVVGPTASGKSGLLGAVAAAEAKRRAHGLPAPAETTAETATPTWDRSKCIVSQFGSPEQARIWLSRVGLSSVPSWTKPHHILSTGERFRADLARRLATCVEHNTGLVLDDFSNSLDRATAANCCIGMAKAIRESGVRAVLATPFADVAQWLQPDCVVVLLGNGAPPKVLANRSAELRPVVSLAVVAAPEACRDAAAESAVPDSAVSDDAAPTLSVSFADAAVADFHCDYDKEPRCISAMPHPCPCRHVCLRLLACPCSSSPCPRPLRRHRLCCCVPPWPHVPPGRSTGWCW